jgi:flavorubredoxin
MRPLVVYHSKFGNTATVARAVADGLGNADLVEAGALTEERLAAAGLLVVGGPTQVDGVSPAMRTLLAGLPARLVGGRPAAAFDTRFAGKRAGRPAAAVVIGRRLRGLGARLAADPEGFLVTGVEGPLVAGEAERARVWGRGLAHAVAGR